MKRFAALFKSLDQTTKTTEKIHALSDFFRDGDADDSVWALFFLTGRSLPKPIRTSELREFISRRSGIPLWLVEECYDTVGDLAETLSLLNPRASSSGGKFKLFEIVKLVFEARPLEEREALLNQLWDELSREETFILHKLITGGFRVGVSEGLIARAIAPLADVDSDVILHRLMGKWEPTSEFWESLISGEISEEESLLKPYPFFLASPLDVELSELGASEDWQAEWKWDGIRAQLIKRKDLVCLWSRGGENLTERFPEIIKSIAPDCPDFVLDGEVLAWRDSRPLPFNLLQTRITRKKVTKNIQRDVPVTFLAYDLLEINGKDERLVPLRERREKLRRVIAELPDFVVISEELSFSSWESLPEFRNSAKARAVEGLMLKKLDSSYGTGRTQNDWLKWKLDPLSIDAVLVYAQKGHGRRANLFTDYTFAVWKGDELVPVAKAYSGLTDLEIQQVDRFIRANTLEKFGPVRTVQPKLVFEIGFEGGQLSSRHKSGVALRFPRILRARSDKEAADADTLETLKGLLQIC